MLFSHDHRHAGPRSQRIYALFEIVYTLVDFGAAFLFLVGSVMFLYDDWTHFGTWLFIIGSVLFCAKPTIRLLRELKLAAICDTEDLANRLGR